MKHFALLLSIVMLSLFCTAQQWNGPMNSTAAIFRTGNVGIGLNFGPLANFAVAGKKIALGGATGNTIYNWGGSPNLTAVEIQAVNSTIPGESYLMLAANSILNTTDFSTLVLTCNLNSGYAGLSASKNGVGAYLPFTISTSALERLRITTTGKVGIGTTSPNGLFHVSNGLNNISNVAIGDFYSGAPNNMANYVGWNASRNGTTWTLFSDGTNNGGSVIATNVSGLMRFITIPTSSINPNLSQSVTDAALITNTRMLIQNNGQVGIAVDLSNATEDMPNDINYKLAVNGKIIAEEVKVQLSQNWPDYVFEPSYHLQPLMELETFIQNNHHLPGVPPQAEVKLSGIELGKMDQTILEKVEELTLYVIQLEKSNQNLQNQIDELKEK